MPENPWHPDGLRMRATIMALVVVIVVASVVARAWHPSFQRPIQYDEHLTLQNYTWAGIRADGTRREMRTHADIAKLEPVSPKRLALGVYASLGRWPEPNNHIPGSVATNFALLLPNATLQAARWPALLSCAGFALLCGLLCLRCGLNFAAPLVSFLAMWHPYCVQFSQECRGYSLMLALGVALVILLQIAARRPASMVWQVICVAIACLSFVNLVNLSIDWVVPVMLAAGLAPGLMLGVEQDAAQRLAWRRNMIGQLLVVGLVGFLFLVDRLPYVYSSAKLYGIPITCFADLLAYAAEAWHANAPNAWWSGLMLVGFTGAGLALSKRETRILAAPWIVAALVSLLHFGLARKFPYVRNLGYLLPLVLLGVGVVLERLVALARESWVKYAVAVTVGVAVVIATFCATPLDLIDHEYVELERHLQAQQATSPPSFCLLGNGVTETIALAGPDTQATDHSLYGITSAQVMVIEKSRWPYHFPGPHQVESDADRPLLSWPDLQHTQIGPYHVYQLPGKPIAPSDWNGTSPAFAIWYPPAELVAVSDERVTSALDAAEVNYARRYVRYPAKLEVFSRLSHVLVELRSAKGREEWLALQKLATELGGELFLMVPSQYPQEDSNL